jgi:glycosyltransferase involved in cell wall biosynthesis
MEKMKVVLVIDVLYQMSGAAKVIKFLATILDKNRYDIDLVVIKDSPLIRPIEGVRVNTLKAQSKVKGVWRLNAIIKLRKMLVKINPDIVCTFVSDSCFITVCASVGLKHKIVSCERGDPFSLPRVWKTITRWSYEHSDFCVFQMEGARSFFQESITKKSCVIPNPFVPLAEPIGADEIRKKTIVSAGRFVHQKGYDVLISAFYIVRKQYPEYKLVLFGEGTLRKMYEDMITKLGLEEAVEMPGFTKSISEAIKHEGVYVLSSRFEGIPNSLLEALSMGLPTISTDCSPGGARFLTDNGKRGIIVPVDNVQAMADAIILLLEDKEKLRELSERGLEIRTLFSPDIISKMWNDLFNTMVLEKKY